MCVCVCVCARACVLSERDKHDLTYLNVCSWGRSDQFRDYKVNQSGNKDNWARVVLKEILTDTKI